MISCVIVERCVASVPFHGKGGDPYEGAYNLEPHLAVPGVPPDYAVLVS